MDRLSWLISSLFLMLLSLFLLCFFYAWHQNAVAEAKYDLAILKQVGELVLSQLVSFFGLHSGLNTQVPWVEKLTGLLGRKNT